MRNHYQVQGDTVAINVWYGNVSLCALIDTTDIPLLEQAKVQWHASPAKAPEGKYYVFAKLRDPESGKLRTVGLHQLIMGTVWKGRGVEVHHKSNDGLDCRRRNLEILSHQANHRERNPTKDWNAYDEKMTARSTHRSELAAANAVIKQFGYTRQYVWKLRTGKAYNTAALDLYNRALLA